MPAMFEDDGSSCAQEKGGLVQVVLLAVGQTVAVIMLSFIETELIAADAVQVAVRTSGLIGQVARDGQLK